MKVYKVEVFPARVPLKKPAESAHGLATEQDSVVVRISTESGQYGVGAIDPLAGYDEESMGEILGILHNHLIPKITGQDPFQIRKILEIMDAEIPGHLGSKAILEMALFDLMGKALGVPVHVLFGGAVRDTIWLNGWVGLVSPEKAQK
jgi:L-alanine-DL-glutamate epimerase-like enolase superfamily enzyme